MAALLLRLHHSLQRAAVCCTGMQGWLQRRQLCCPGPGICASTQGALHVVSPHSPRMSRRPGKGGVAAHREVDLHVGGGLQQGVHEPDGEGAAEAGAGQVQRAHDGRLHGLDQQGHLRVRGEQAQVAQAVQPAQVACTPQMVRLLGRGRSAEIQGLICLLWDKSRLLWDKPGHLAA